MEETKETELSKLIRRLKSDAEKIIDDILALDKYDPEQW